MFPICMNIRLWDFKIGSDKQIVPIKRGPINESLNCIYMYMYITFAGLKYRTGYMEF